MRLYSLISGTWEYDDFAYTASGAAGSAFLSINDVTVAEGNGGTTSAVFTVTRSGSTSPTVTVSYATANGTGTAGSDYVATAGSLTFSSGVTTRPISVVVNGDTTVEPNETFFVNLSSPSGAALSDAQGQGNITNDDSAALPTLSIGDASVTEGNSGTKTATFTATLSAAASSTVSVGYSTANGTATAGSDYVAGSGTLTFTAGQTTKTIAVVVNGDTTVEPNETFTVNLANPTRATILDGQGVGTITNDDSSTPTKAAMVSPTAGSTLTSSTATFSWTPGIGVSSYGLQVGTTPGGNQIVAGTQYSTTSATISGLPTNGSLLYVRLWSLMSGTWQSNDTTYRAAGTP